MDAQLEGPLTNDDDFDVVFGTTEDEPGRPLDDCYRE